MNNVDVSNISRRGIILTDNVDLSLLKDIKPRYNNDFCKFVINKSLNKVAVGMDVHAESELCNGDDDNIYGGNIFFDNAEIIYESTVNIKHNLQSEYYKQHLKESPNPRIINDPEIISIINSVLLEWIKL